MTNDCEQQNMKEYYNVPSSMSSEEPMRPPRSCDDGSSCGMTTMDTLRTVAVLAPAAAAKVPSYCNLPRDKGELLLQQPPMLPRRQPHMRRSPVARRSHLPPPPPPQAADSAQPPQVFLPGGGGGTARHSCSYSTTSTASPTLRSASAYQNYRRRVPINRSRTMKTSNGSCLCGGKETSSATLGMEGTKYSSRDNFVFFSRFAQSGKRIFATSQIRSS